MDHLLPSRKVYLAESNLLHAGRGVFALQDIKKDETIEICPVIVIPDRSVLKLIGSVLDDYVFNWGEVTEWGENLNKLAIALGYGSLYNHSYRPNARYRRNYKENSLHFIAIQDIRKDEEIKVNYNGNPEITKPVHQTGVPPYDPRI